MIIDYLHNNVVAIVSLIIAVIALIFTAVNYRQVKKDAYNNLAISLIEQKNAYLESYLNNLVNTSEKASAYVDRELATNYCNAFEHACGLYLKGGIDKKLFLDTFKDEIISIGNGEGIAKRVDLEHISDSCYSNIKEVCKIIKN